MKNMQSAAWWEIQKKKGCYLCEGHNEGQTERTVCTVGRKLAELVSTYEKKKMKASSFSYHHEKP